MKVVEIPDSLAELVQASGADLKSFVVEAIEEKLSYTSPDRGRTFGEVIAGGWIPPTVHGTPRDDGVPWSQIEAPCDQT